MMYFVVVSQSVPGKLNILILKSRSHRLIRVKSSSSDRWSSDADFVSLNKVLIDKQCQVKKSLIQSRFSLALNQ